MNDKAAHSDDEDTVLERIEHAVEHAGEALRDRARALELGLLKGDHTPRGEVASILEEVVHPEGKEGASGSGRS